VALTAALVWSTHALAEPTAGLHLRAELGLGAALGSRRYDGPTLDAGSASYTDSFSGLAPVATLGAEWRPSERWGVGLRGLVGWAPGLASGGSTIAGVPFGELAFAGGEVTTSLFFDAGIKPCVVLGVGFVAANFGGEMDTPYAPGLVADAHAFEHMSGMSVALSFEPHALRLGPLVPMLALRGARLWHASGAATLLVPTLGAAIYL
jgi:hypothetical protein